MLDVDALIEECRVACDETEPLLAVRDVVTRAIARTDDVVAALPPERAEIVALHVSPELTVLKAAWAPGMTLWPHDHRMWAVIAVYAGGEDNEFYRRAGGSITSSGGRALRTGDVCLLGADVIHAVTNPTAVVTGAIHVYGGDFFATPRSEWDVDTLEERPLDVARVQRHFDDANARADGSA